MSQKSLWPSFEIVIILIFIFFIQHDMIANIPKIRILIRLSLSLAYIMVCRHKVLSSTINHSYFDHV